MKLTHKIIDTMVHFEPRENYFSDIGLTHTAIHDAMLEDYPEWNPDSLRDIDILTTIERILDCSGVPYGLKLNDGIPGEIVIGEEVYKLCKHINSGTIVLTECKYGRKVMTAWYSDYYNITRFYDGDYSEMIRWSFSTQCNIQAIREFAVEGDQ